jgi:hypothetical protein
VVVGGCPDLGREDGEEQSIQFLLLSHVQASVRLGNVVKEKDVFHVMVRTDYGCTVTVCLVSL